MNWFRIIMVAVVIICGMAGLGYMHEVVHQEIFRAYGIESEVSIDFPDLVTTGDEACPTDSCVLAHNINEIVGYPMAILYVVFGLLYFFSVIEAELKKDEDRWII